MPIDLTTQAGTKISTVRLIFEFPYPSQTATLFDMQPLPGLRPSFKPDYQHRSQEVLDFALEWIPGYRDWKRFDPGSHHPVDERYDALPVTSKAHIRSHFPDGLRPLGRTLQAGLDSQEIELVHTSGTTEERVSLPWNQTWWNASETAAWALHSDTARLPLGRHPEAILANPISVGIRNDDRSLSFADRSADRFLFLNEKSNPLAWDAAHYERMIRELQTFQPVVLEANPSLLADFAHYLLDQKRSCYCPPVIILTYEFPSRLFLRVIRKAFACPIINSYGSTEAGYVFMECEAGRYHQNTDFCRIDFQTWRPTFGNPRIGRILVTPFKNPWLPLIRFDISDLARIAAPQTCPCGRTDGWILEALEGRVRDVTLTLDNRPVTVNRLDEVLSQVPGLRGYQVEQLTLNSFRVHAAVAPPAPAGLDSVFRQCLESLYGAPLHVEIHLVSRVPPEISAKNRLAKNHLPLDPETHLETSHA
jgi:phenylacetate-CoA ligase